MIKNGISSCRWKAGCGEITVLCWPEASWT